MKKTLALSLVLAVLIFSGSVKIAEAFSCSSNSTGGGNFNLASTWTGCNSTTPQTTDSITINNGDTVTLVATTTVAGITINSSGILAANTRTLTNTDGYTNNGSHTGTTSAMTLSGITGTIIAGNGSYFPTGVVTINTGNKTIASGSSLSFPSITIGAVTVTNNSTAGFSVTTVLSGTGQLTQGANSILNIGGTSAITTLDASTSPNDVHYTSTTGSQTIKAPSTAYHNLFIDKLGRTGTLAATTTINSNLTVTAGTLADGGFQIVGNSTGTLSLSDSTTLTLGTTADATNFPTSFTAAHISLNTTSTVNYNSNFAQTISNVPTYGNLKTNANVAVTKTADGALTINGVFTNGINNVFADGGFTITVKGNSTMTGSHTGLGKILFTGGVGAHVLSGTGSYTNIELNDSNGVTQSVTTTVNGTLTLTSGPWTASNTLTVTGGTLINGTLSITSTTGNKTFGNLTVNNGGILSFSAAEALSLNGDITVNGTGAISGTSGTWTLQKVGGGTIGGTTSSLAIGGNLTFATQYAINYPLTVNGFAVNSGVTETNTSTITVNGTLSGAGTFTQNSGTNLSARSITITALNAVSLGNTVYFIGAVGGTIKGTSYVDMEINKSTGFTATANGTVNVTGNLTVTSGTISFAGSTFTVSGTTDIYGTLTDTSGGGAGGNNIFTGLVTIHPGAIWLAVVGEVCDFHFVGGLVMNGASFTSSTGIYYFETNNQSITGSSTFTIDNLDVTGIQLTNSSSGDLTVGSILSGSGEFIQDTNAVLNIAGTSTITTLTAQANGNTVNYTGTAAQTVHAGTYQTLAVDSNTTGSVDITADTTVNTVLTLGGALLSTATNKIILGTSVTPTRTTGYIIGTVEKQFNTSGSFTFPIGDAGSYTPIDLTLSGVTGSSSIDGSVINTDHSDIASSDVDSTKTVNRYWSLTNNGLTFTNYSVGFNFVSGDFDSGATVSDMTIAKRSSGGSWSILTATCAATSCTASGLTSMSDFQIGVETPSTSSSSSSSSSTTSTSSSSSSSSTSSTAAPAGQVFLAAAPQIVALAPSTNDTPALFDILSAPLLRNSSGTIIPVMLSTFSVGSLSGLLVVAVKKRRRRDRIQKILAEANL